MYARIWSLKTFYIREHNMGQQKKTMNGKIIEKMKAENTREETKRAVNIQKS